MATHRQRAAKIRAYTEKNKAFSVIAVILIAFLAVSAIRNSIDKTKTSDNSAITAVEEEAVDTSSNEERPHWRFYLSDFVILGAGGGYCCYKILQERKRAKENL